MHTQTLSRNLLIELMERWNCRNKQFELPPGNITITLMDVALILGLRVTGERVVLKEDSPISVLEKDYGATTGKRSISVSSLEKRLESLEKDATEDFVRSFLLFAFGAFLFPNANGTVDSRYLSLMEDLDRVPQLAWGSAVLEDLFNWIHEFKNDKKLKHMGSCLIFLQLWSYEHIDIARPSSLKCNLVFPRSCKWKNSSFRQRDWFTPKFNELQGNQMVWKLEPTSEEAKIDIIKNLLEMQNAVLEISSTSQYSTSDKDDVDGSIRDETFRLDKQVIELDDSETDTIEDSVEVQEDNFELLSTPQYASTDATAGHVYCVRAKKLLEDQVVKLNKEIDLLKLNKESLLEDQIVKLNMEIDELRIENTMLKNQILLSDNCFDRMEKIVIEVDTTE
ncbi:Serine/threonine-protein phosphatase 7 long form-like protein [Thalictrum thalictroides]|uniref:Serine/threonine-protein phosphatase 7 long form-like protein n=1 Tax=Thalictrum thalictroides TaxID=46969 RepID=A0A7J6XA65_THATH|nr:Serine/threonine-protein phosphatase 7 long form-like protein [Thalictrum thalictroides]